LSSLGSFDYFWSPVYELLQLFPEFERFMAALSWHPPYAPFPLPALNTSKAYQVELHFHNSFNCVGYFSTCTPFPILRGSFTFACAAAWQRKELSRRAAGDDAAEPELLFTT